MGTKVVRLELMPITVLKRYWLVYEKESNPLGFAGENIHSLSGKIGNYKFNKWRYIVHQRNFFFF